MPYLILFLSYIGIILSKDASSWINFAEFSIWKTEEMARVKQSMIKRLVFGRKEVILDTSCEGRQIHVVC